MMQGGGGGGGWAAVDCWTCGLTARLFEVAVQSWWGAGLMGWVTRCVKLDVLWHGQQSGKATCARAADQRCPWGRVA